MSGQPLLKPGQPVGPALQAIARDCLNQARATLEDSGREPTRKVHDIRRAMKRWRAMLRMLAPFLGEGATLLRQDARALARKLTHARDAQSAIDAFQDAAEAGLSLPEPLGPRSLISIQTRLEELRAHGEQSIWTDALQREFSDYLIAATAQVAHWDMNTLSFSELAGTVTKTYRRARRAIPENWEQIDAEALHEFRRRVVEHRYQMELLEPVWPRVGKIWVEEAQRLRNRLGKYQDLAVLTEKTLPHQPLARWRSRLVPLIAHRQSEHASGARKLATRLFAEKPNAFHRRLEALWEAQTGD